MVQQRERKARLNLADIRIGFRNFAGEKGRYNKEGERSFAIFFDDEQLAERLKAEGWNVKWPKPKPEIYEDPEEDTRTPYLTVKVNYNGQFGPKIVVKSGTVVTPLTYEEVGMLDHADIIEADVVINPYHYTGDDGKPGISAYLKSLYVTLESDDFAEKYGVL